MLFTPLAPCHKLSHLLRPPPPLEHDVLYGRPLVCMIMREELADNVEVIAFNSWQ